jgi:hypothetical protein
VPHLLFCAKNIERIGDHATNIAETIYYVLTGEQMPADRQKMTVHIPSCSEARPGRKPRSSSRHHGANALSFIIDRLDERHGARP